MIKVGCTLNLWHSKQKALDPLNNDFVYKMEREINPTDDWN